MPIILLTSVGYAYAQSKPTEPLHEDLQAPQRQTSRTTERIKNGIPILGASPKALQNPAAIASQDKLLAEPSNSVKSGSEEPIHGKSQFATTRQKESKPDYQTNADNELKYVVIFNPSIVPFKRMSVFDSVREDYSLSLSSGTLIDVPVGRKARANKDLFWASLVVELKPGRDIPIPSVSPKMRILSYESTPALPLTFSKDSADNFYLRTEESGISGIYRIVMLVEASPSYFAPIPPKRIRIRDIPDDKKHPLPTKVQKVADQFLSDMRLHRNMFLDIALNKLVFYFRSFSAKAPPSKSGDIYLDLVTNQAGVCRHRSFAFMVTANALGIPTRYISNEAHAWVEVWLPQSEWIRIDLGGAASTLTIKNAADKSMYRPRAEDPFRKPEAYNQNYTRLEGDVRGLRDSQIKERQIPYAGKEGNGTFFGENSDEFTPEAPSQNSQPLTGPGEELPAIPQEQLAGKFPTQIEVLSASKNAYRGESMLVTGQVTDAEGQGLDALRINIFLAPTGAKGSESQLVGQGISDGKGHFELSITLPSSLKTQSYEVFASTPGNETTQPSVSR